MKTAEELTEADAMLTWLQHCTKDEAMTVALAWMRDEDLRVTAN